MKGLVLKSTGNNYKVKDEKGEIIDCRIKGKLRLNGIRSTNPIAVGDYVSFDLENETEGVITNIEKRKNYIIRKASNLSKESQIIAANVDMAYLVVTIHSPQTLLQFIDRFLVTAEAYDIPCTILINKYDLFQSEEDQKIIEEWKEIYRLAGYDIMCISTKTGYNIDELKKRLAGKISVLSGNSGVGKTSLIQAITNQKELKISEISKSFHKGQHTTTFAEMYETENYGSIIDTPGVKAFGLLDMKSEEMCHYFPEIFKYSSDCQFNNCTHSHEPKCNVIRAVEEGNIPISRYQNYLTFMDDKNAKHREAQ
ncbi:MAG: ribosome small subunit-dependent GTPase A [Bacteroidales bacterium]|nr:ribosome small subunit-dependent GTPase A [Bacteroidales bacterium]